MIGFFVDLGSYRFLQYAVTAAALAAVACGVVGTLVTVNRMSYAAGSISHTVLGGMGLFRYLFFVTGLPLFTPFAGAVTAALAAAVVLAMVTHGGRERMDTPLAAIWSVGMSAGVKFIFATPGYSGDLMSYLFGNILLIGKTDLLLILVLDILILSVVLSAYTKLYAVSFDREYASVRGLRVRWIHLLLLVLVALTIVLLVTVVGIVMASALLPLPAATAGLFAKSLPRMMVLSSVIAFLCTISGIVLSYGPDLPAGATVILFSAAVYLVARGLKAVAARRESRGAVREPSV